jgi:GntR family transcriptional regulator
MCTAQETTFVMIPDSKFSIQQYKPLKQGDPTPLYYQLYSLLKHDILNGTLKNGSQIPTEPELSKLFNISRITTKRALNELAAEGLVTRQRAKGTHVTHEYTPKPVKAPLIGMLQEIESMARHSEAKILEVIETIPPSDICKELGLASNDTALKMTRVRIRDNEPFAYYTSWSLGLKHSIDEKSLRSTPRLEVFRQNGVQISHVKQILTATAATPEVAAELQVETGFPLLKLVRRSFDKDEKLVDFLQCLYHPDLTPEQTDTSVQNSKQLNI